MTDLDQLDADVKRYLELDSKKADIEIEQGIIKERLRALGLGAHQAPCGVAVSVSPNRRFNVDKATEVVPDDLLSLCMDTVISATKAKKVLPPAIYELAMVEVGEPRVMIR